MRKRFPDKEKPREESATAPAGSGAGWRWIVLVLVLAGATYARVGGLGFTSWDDDRNVTQNPLLHPVSLANLQAIWARPYASLYIPVVYTSYLFDLAVGGGRAAVFHLTNLALHLGSTLLVYLLLRRWVRALVGETSDDRMELAAALGAALFALHPMQVESVAWVTGRKDTLAGLLALGSIAAWERWRRGRAGVASARGAPGWMAASLALFALSVLAKPTMVAVAPALVVLEVAVHGSRPAAAARATAAWVAGAVLAAIALRGSQPPTQDLLAMTPLLRRPAIAADAVLFYLGKLAFPHPLAAVYGRSPQAIFESIWPWIALPAALGLAVAVVRYRPSRAPALLLLALLSPTLGFVPFLFQTYSTVADRYMYLPMIGVALGGALAAEWGLRCGRLTRVQLGAVAVLLVGSWCVLTFRQIGVWESGETVWANSVRHYPAVPEAQANLGAEYGRQGRIAEARARFEEAIRLAPDWGEIRMNLGLTYFSDPATLPRAMELLGQGLVMSTRSGDLPGHRFNSHYHLARGCLRLNQPTEAERHLLECLALRKDDAMVYFFLGMAQEQLGQNQASEASYARAEALAPGRLPPRAK